jgi:hypothetical protein
MKIRETSPLMDWMRPLGSDGTLHSVLLSTYGLSLSDPPFFDQDFLPTLLGLGGVRERGYSSPANVERRLGQFYCGVVCDAHALAQGGRPSLRVEVIPIGHQLNHAKVVLIHRERLVRLVIGSANLTHEGFRKNREAAMVLDFKEDGELPPEILTEFAENWLARLGPSVTTEFRRSLEQSVAAAQDWKPRRKPEINVRTLWGGGPAPLWQQIGAAWPKGEKLRVWTICSPFWPNPGEADTPFDALRRELDERGADTLGAKIKLFTSADVAGSRGRPCFPFELISQLAQRGFKPADAEICPVRLDALANEVPDGRAEDHRPLHAKWIYLCGDRTSLLVLGSANFTRRGLGVLKKPVGTNIEVVVLISGPGNSIPMAALLPPIAESGIVRWGDCLESDLSVPVQDVEQFVWPDFIFGIELEVRWEKSPLVGRLRVKCAKPVEFTVAMEDGDESATLLTGVTDTPSERITELDETQVTSLLIRRGVWVTWGLPRQKVWFPINIAGESKHGLPAVLGQKPTEQDLLAYFHGRIDEEDLMDLLIERGRQKEAGDGTAFDPPGRELQNYVVREFLEGLYGMEEVLRDASASPRMFEQALLGEFSPLRLATEIQSAMRNGRRTATAAGFQLVELIRLVERLEARNPKQREAWFASTREKTLEELMKVVSSASGVQNFLDNCNAPPFREFVRGVLGSETATKWWAAMETS